VEEWAYVTSPVGVVRRAGSGVGARDKGRRGWNLSRFQEVVNEYVKGKHKRAAEKGREEKGRRASRGGAAGAASSGNDDGGEEEVLLLTVEEVAAIRLYTGPGYQPVNNFLREVTKLGTVLPLYSYCTPTVLMLYCTHCTHCTDCTPHQTRIAVAAEAGVHASLHVRRYCVPFDGWTAETGQGE
jgi:hypothetical protein